MAIEKTKKKISLVKIQFNVLLCKAKYNLSAVSKLLLIPKVAAWGMDRGLDGGAASALSPGGQEVGRMHIWPGLWPQPALPPCGNQALIKVRSALIPDPAVSALHPRP